MSVPINLCRMPFDGKRVNTSEIRGRKGEGCWIFQFTVFECASVETASGIRYFVEWQ
jgi:hypothetical protein